MVGWSDQNFPADHPASYIPQRTADISQSPIWRVHGSYADKEYDAIKK